MVVGLWTSGVGEGLVVASGSCFWFRGDRGTMSGNDGVGLLCGWGLARCSAAQLLLSRSAVV